MCRPPRRSSCIRTATRAPPKWSPLLRRPAGSASQAQTAKCMAMAGHRIGRPGRHQECDVGGDDRSRPDAGDLHGYRLGSFHVVIERRGRRRGHVLDSRLPAQLTQRYGNWTRTASAASRREAVGPEFLRHGSREVPTVRGLRSNSCWHQGEAFPAAERHCGQEPNAMVSSCRPARAPSTRAARGSSCGAIGHAAQCGS